MFIGKVVREMASYLDCCCVVGNAVSSWVSEGGGYSGWGEMLVNVVTIGSLTLMAAVNKSAMFQYGLPPNSKIPFGGPACFVAREQKSKKTKQKWTLEMVADRSNGEFSASDLSRYESSQQLDIDVLRQIAKALGVKVGTILKTAFVMYAKALQQESPRSAYLGRVIELLDRKES
jgi:transcriptional regulator with XRE-family HTH domain